MNTQFSILGCPIDCLGFDGALQGTERSPQTLRDLGIAQALQAQDLGDAPVRITAAPRHDRWGVVSFDSVRATTQVLRSQVAGLQRQGHRLLVLGGCCTQMMGVLAGSRDALGAVGVAYADGHLDLYDGQTSPTGEAADMALAALLGRGPAPLLRAMGGGAVLAPAQAVMLGYRDGAEAQAHHALMPADIGPGFHAQDVEALRRIGPATVGAAARRQLEIAADHFWIHIDLDVLDAEVFPATDYLMPGGLTWAELDSLLRPLGRSDRLAGVAIACYNPAKDPDLRHARRLIAHLQTLLA